MVNLEELDDKTLHQKCLEFGLPNVAITDTSRNLIIKRLKIAMGSDDTSKEGPEKSSKSAASRKSTATSSTPAPPSASTPALEKASTPAPVTQRRRSGRLTPGIQPEAVVPETTKTKMKESTIQEEHDVISLEDDSNSEHSRPSSRHSRASSLSPSAVVTTSYVKKAREPIYEEDCVEDESSYNRYIGHNVVFGYETNKTHFSSTTNPSSTKQLSSQSKVLSSTPPRITSFEPTLSLNRRYQSIGGSEIYGHQSHMTTQRPMRASYSAIGAENESTESEPRYLSEFARKLSRLKAESIDAGLPSIRNEILRERNYSAKYSPRSNLNHQAQNQNDIASSFNNLVNTIDHQYGIKSKLYIAAGICLLIFIYSYFF